MNGEAIYKSKPWKIQNDTLTKDVWYTQGQNGNLYAILLSWPPSNTLKLSKTYQTNDNTQITMLGSTENIKVRF